MITRRKFLRLAGVGAAIAANPLVFAVKTNRTVDELDQICRQIGEFSRKHGLHVERIIGLDESCCLVLSAKIGQEYPSFHIADRELKYRQLSYKQYGDLRQADCIFVFVWFSGEEQPYSFRTTLE